MNIVPKCSHHKQKAARKELKKTLKANEKCPYCKKMQFNLDEHIRLEHSFRCERCGIRFGSNQQWKQHMRDRHGLKEKAAVHDDRKKKIERWLDKADGPAEEAEADGPMSTSEVFTLTCEVCGASAEVPMDLAEHNMGFQCAFLGRACGASAPTGRGIAMPTAIPALNLAPMSQLVAAQASPGIFFGSTPAAPRLPAVPSDDEDL